MKIGAIIQARVSSTRLPGKVLKELPYGSGISVLGQVIRRLKRSKELNDIIVATTTGKDDDKIVAIAKKENVKYFRGSREDVLSRYYWATEENDLDIIVRVTSDRPCIDPEIMDSIIEKHMRSKADYTSNMLERTYPQGLGVEVFSFNVLKKTYENAQTDYEKEHVTPYVYRNPNIFRIIHVKAPKELYASDIRITLDTEEDYALICTVFDYLYLKDKYFTAYDIMNLFKEKPWLKLVNKKGVQKKMFDTFKEEFEEAIKTTALQDLGGR